MKSLLNFEKLAESTGVVFRRFPLAMLFAILTTWILVYQSGRHGEAGWLTEPRLPLTGYVLFLWCINLQILREVNGWPDKWYVPAVGMVVGASAILYGFMPVDLHSYSCIWFFVSGLAGMLHFSVSYLPYLKNYNDRYFLHYNIEVLGMWLKAAFYSLIWYAAASLALLALDKLFGVNVGIFSYLRLFIVSAGVLHSFYFLSSFPNEYTRVINFQPKSLFVILVKYALIPITLIYGLIVYAYIVKLWMTGHSTEYWVSELIIWYFAVGILTYLFLHAFDDGIHNKVSIFYKKWYLILSFPLVLFLFFTVYKEINESGVTDGSYLKALIFSWLFVVIAIREMVKKYTHIFIPLSISVAILIGFMSGPFSVCKVPDRSQQKKLISLLKEKSIIKNEELMSSEKIIWEDSLGTVASILLQQHAKNKLDFLRPYDKNGLLPPRDSFFHVDDFLQKTGIQSSTFMPGRDNYYNFSSTVKSSIGLQGFDELLPVLNTWDKEPPGLHARLFKHGIQIYEGQKLLKEMDIRNRLPYPLKEDTVDPLILDFSDTDARIKMVVYSMYATGNWPDIEISEMNALILFAGRLEKN
ncbi:MAG: DUF4153 domain-containing protein [Saprospiraceae bacterium]|nr:DUF4153 domain-containing protein [Saprospiraceae bacterium]